VNRSSPEYSTFKALIAAMSKVDNAIGSPPSSKARNKLARRILSSSKKMQSYRPLLPLQFHERIQAREAFRASRALRQLVYPVMLGTDEELAQVKEALAGAALRIGITNWVQVGDLEETSRYGSGRKGFALGLPFPWLVGVVIPLITALIAVLANLLSPSSPSSPSPSSSAVPTVSVSPVPTASLYVIPTASFSIFFSASSSPPGDCCHILGRAN